MRSDWSDLPALVQDEIQDRTGKVFGSEPAEAGNHSDITTTLHTEKGLVFIKGVRVEPDRQDVRTLRHEAVLLPHFTEHAPRLLWQTEAGGWLVLGYEHINGRNADYTPGSPDLDLLAETIHTLQAMPFPDAVTHPIEQRWAHLADDVTSMSGDCLIHADLNPGNLLITPEGRAYAVDWAFCSRGAAWVELLLLTPWLLRDGMEPADTAAWVSQFPAWTDADPAHIDLGSRLLAEQWRRRTHLDPAGWVSELAALTRRWADYRAGT